MKIELTRDPLGLKPLYYCLNGESILHSPDISRIIALLPSPPKPCESMISQLLAGEFLDYDLTFFEGIMQVPPGHTLIFENGKKQLRLDWDPSRTKPRVYRRKEQYYEEFLEIFKKSVEKALEGGNAGLLLSGGLDSSQICAVAGPRAKSACLLVEGFLQEEKENIEFLRKLGADIEFVDYSAEQKTRSMFELFMEPGATPHIDAFLTTPLLLENLAARGCKVLITGFGANELSNPMETGWLMDLLRNFRLPSFFRECGRYAESAGDSTGTILKMVLGETVREICPDFLRARIRARRNAGRPWLNRNFRNKMPGRPPARLRPFHEMAQNKTFQALFEPLMPPGLAQMHEAASKYGMEIRHPFLDLELVEYFLSIPAEIKLENGFRKSFVQKALAPSVPLPFKNNEDPRPFIPMNQGESRIAMELERLRNYLSSPDSPVYRYLDYSEVQSMLRPGNRNANLPLLWRFARLEKWLVTWSKCHDIFSSVASV